MLQELSDESRRMGLKMNIAETKVMIVDNIENVQGYMYLGVGTTLQPEGKEPAQRDTMKIRGRLGCIRQTPGCLQKQPCHLPEDI